MISTRYGRIQLVRSARHNFWLARLRKWRTHGNCSPQRPNFRRHEFCYTDRSASTGLHAPGSAPRFASAR